MGKRRAVWLPGLPLVHRHLKTLAAEAEKCGFRCYESVAAAAGKVCELVTHGEFD